MELIPEKIENKKFSLYCTVPLRLQLRVALLGHMHAGINIPNL